MTSLADHHASSLVKMLYIGDSGTGKTGSLVSLVAAGYKLHVLDLDNGLDVLAQYIRRDCPDKLANVDFETRRDKYKSTNAGPVIVQPVRAFADALALMTKWSDDSDPSKWGDNTILVLDSLSAFSRAAFEWAKSANPSTKDPRQWFYAAQQAVESAIALLTSEDFATNLIVISHVNLTELPDGTVKGFANAVGKAMGPIIPRYFNNLILAESSGSGQNVKRVLRTLPTGIVDLKTSAPFKIADRLDLSSGLATIFSNLKDKK